MDNLIKIDDFFKTKMAVGTIKHVELVPKSTKLYQLEVDLGELGIRKLVSGIAKHYTIEELINSQVIVIVNLEPATIMGVESFGMLLACDDKSTGKVVLLRPEIIVENGSSVR